MKSFMVFSSLLCCGAFGLAGAAPNECLCGDVNCDGVLDAYDGIYILNYLCGGGPAPLTADLEHADWDSHQTLTIDDVWRSTRGYSPYCPPAYGPWIPQIYDGDTLYFTNRVRAGASSSSALLNFQLFDIFGVLAFEFPLKIRVNGQIPTIDSIVFTLADDHPITNGCHAVYPDSGCFTLGVSWSAYIMQNLDNIATVFFSVPSDESERPVTVEWVSLTPMQAAAPDSSVIPVMLKNEYEKNQAYSHRVPVLAPTCCILAGDVNDDGKVNIGDAVYQINYAFLFGPRPPCMAQADANGDGKFNVGDAVFLINYIFRGGPAPICK